ncbi:MAG: hypothetical protein V4651_05410, partial [Bacteroidota bacterium]
MFKAPPETARLDPRVTVCPDLAMVSEPSVLDIPGIDWSKTKLDPKAPVPVIAKPETLLELRRQVAQLENVPFNVKTAEPIFKLLLLVSIRAFTCALLPKVKPYPLRLTVSVPIPFVTPWLVGFKYKVLVPPAPENVILEEPFAVKIFVLDDVIESLNVTVLDPITNLPLVKVKGQTNV